LIAALSIRALERLEFVGALDRFFELGEQVGADRGVAGGLVGVVADHEPVGGVRELDLLDLHVVGDVRVASLAGQGCLGGG
jgi:hypothetical protein